jgi:1-acyl-sn-glycerol-3-phosphate acyltransferase
MIATALAALARLITGATIEWRCDPHGAVQRVYFGNHSSHLDFVVIWSALPPALRLLARPVAARDYWEKGAVRRYLAGRVFHAVLIERGKAGAGNAAAAARSIQQIADEIGTRYSLIVFPEGTRSLTGEVGPFKSGLYHLSRLRPDLELIPVNLENLHRILPKGKKLPVPMSSRVVFGPPFRPATEDKNGFLEKAREALLQLRVSSLP